MVDIDEEFQGIGNYGNRRRSPPPRENQPQPNPYSGGGGAGGADQTMEAAIAASLKDRQSYNNEEE